VSLEHKTLAFEVKALDEAAGTITLYAAIFGNLDRQGDIIEPGAFRNLPEFVADGWLDLNHHNYSLPIGTIEAATQDAKGLLVTARFHTTEEAQKCRTVVRERMDRGKTVKCSIGYRTIDAAFEQRDGDMVRRLKSIEVFEVSVVNLPANPMAEVTGVKGVERLSELKAEVAAILSRPKSGRVLSSANRQRLSEHLASMRSVCADIEKLLADTDPEKGDPPTGGGAGSGGEAPSDDDGGKLLSLRARALRGRAFLPVVPVVTG
jgi:HK97 family phage prohead protease